MNKIFKLTFLVCLSLFSSNGFCDSSFYPNKTAQIYYAENIMRGKILEANCQKGKKKNLKNCLYKLTLTKLYKGDSKLVGKEVFLEEKEVFPPHFGRFYQKNEEDIFLFDRIECDGKLVLTPSAPREGDWSRFGIDHEPQLDSLLKEQKDLKYRPAKDPMKFVGLTPWEAWNSYSAPVILEAEIFKIKTVNVSAPMSTANGYEINLKITRVLKGKVNARLENKEIKHFYTYIKGIRSIELNAKIGSKCLFVFLPTKEARNYESFSRKDYVFFHGNNASTEKIEYFLRLLSKHPWYIPQEVTGGDVFAR